MSTKISDQSFETDVLKSSKPVLVDFWAEWCGPCKALAPALEEIAQTLGDKVTVAKLNIDENPRTTKNYGVKGIPTLMLFKNGQVAGTRIGNLPKSQLVAWVQSVL
jgi:thioredoxin 1